MIWTLKSGMWVVWLDPATRRPALARLAAVTTKNDIWYGQRPDGLKHWIPESAILCVVPDPGDGLEDE